MSLSLVIDGSLSARVRLAALVVVDLAVRQESPALMAEIEAVCQSLRERYGGQPSGEVPDVLAARQLYKALGLDPTKTRPSSESLLRRALKGQPLYRINTLVDSVNLRSLADQLPYGLYDLGRVAPPILLRMGADGEGYEGIRKGFVSVARRPALVDAIGPFGNPTSDSLRTSITLDTRAALVVVYAPRHLGGRALARTCQRTLDLVLRHSGGRLGEQLFVPEGE
jgi:DNA/RNA-binding domain of Phe-tRNA-synthetase-like protein